MFSAEVVVFGFSSFVMFDKAENTKSNGWINCLLFSAEVPYNHIHGPIPPLLC